MTAAEKRIPPSLSGPVVVERHDQEDGQIFYELWDHGPGNYHCICVVREDLNDYARGEAEFIALALNNAIGALKAVAMAEK